MKINNEQKELNDMELTDDELNNITGGNGKTEKCSKSPTGCHEGIRLTTIDGAFGPLICKHCHIQL